MPEKIPRGITDRNFFPAIRSEVAVTRLGRLGMIILETLPLSYLDSPWLLSPMNSVAIEPTDDSRLEDSLRESATAIAGVLQARLCSILLVSERERKGRTEHYLQVIAHFGKLDRAAYQTASQFDRGIAGTVAATGKSLLISDIRRSPFRALARYEETENPSFLSVPIGDGDRVIGVINVSRPENKSCFEERDREILELLSRQVAQSLHISHLQGMLRSRFLTMALTRELEESRTTDPVHESDLFERAVRTPPPKLAKIVAKAFFKELTRAGFGPHQVIEIATEVLSLLQKTLDKHKNRLEGRD
jgi:L-methionine (R)-S-oxide reductase